MLDKWEVATLLCVVVAIGGFIFLCMPAQGEDAKPAPEPILTADEIRFLKERYAASLKPADNPTRYLPPTYLIDQSLASAGENAKFQFMRDGKCVLLVTFDAKTRDYVAEKQK